MTITPLSAEEARAHGYNLRVNIDYTDLTDTAGLTKAVAIYPKSGNCSIGTTVLRAAARVVTAFAGCTTLGLEIGDGGDVNRHLVSVDCKGTAGVPYASVPSTTPYAYVSGDTIDALFTATVDNLTALTAGNIDIFLFVADLSTLKTA